MYARENLGAKAHDSPKKWIKTDVICAMSFISSSAFHMATSSAQKYRSSRLAVKMIQLWARANRYRMKLAITGKKSSLAVSVSPKTAETYGIFLNLSYVEAVREIFLITRDCLRSSGLEEADF